MQDQINSTKILHYKDDTKDKVLKEITSIEQITQSDDSKDEKENIYTIDYAKNEVEHLDENINCFKKRKLEFKKIIKKEKEKEKINTKKEKRIKVKASKYICFTLNNWTEDHINIFRIFQEENCKYLIIGKEKSKTGTPHLQGYMELNSPKTYEEIKELLNIKDIHLEKRKGTGIQASTYCKKENNYTEYGIPPQNKGQRNDLEDLAVSISRGISFKEIFDEYPTHCIRYLNNIDKLINRFEAINALAIPYRKVRVICLLGQTNTGKTRYVFENEPIDQIYKLDNSNNLWFDGYDHHKVLLIDDFYGNNIDYGHLLNILDGYPLRLEIKGSFKYAYYDKVYITSNSHPRFWYKKKNIDALYRRIEKYFIFYKDKEMFETKDLGPNIRFD